MKLVLVEWLDACSTGEVWTTRRKLKKQKPCMVHTVGYLIADEPGFVTVVNSIVLEDDTSGGDNTIPRGMIQLIVELQEREA